MLGTHPKGLPILFFTEMWERFSYYGMRALLVLYLVNHLDYERANALHVYATYTALVYLTPILGGFLADRYLGTHRSILIGAIVMSMGHFAMASEDLLFLALGLLIVGNGFFKPNISTLVGQLYSQDDPRRDSGFTLFYMGINLGAFFSPLVCGTLGEVYGWHYGFSAAGIGMLLGLTIFVYGQTYLVPHDNSKHHQLNKKDWVNVFLWSISSLVLVYLIVKAWPVISPLWTNEASGFKTFVFFAIAVFFIAACITFLRTLKKYSRVEQDRLWVILILGLFVIFFWMGFEQAGGTLNLFADQLTDRNFMDWEMPASYFQSLNPLLILLLAPIFAVFWMRLDQSPYALSIPVKMALGMIILGLGFVVMVFAQQHAEAIGKVSPIWLVIVYTLFTIGELFLSPIGLSMVTKLSAASLVSMMMGIWFSFIAIASYLAGTLESLIEQWNIPLYSFLVMSSMGAGVTLLLISPALKKRMH